MTGPDPAAADLTTIADRLEALRYAKAKEAEWKEVAAALRSEVEDAMGGPDGPAEVGTIDGKPVVRWTRVKSNRLNQAALKRERPDVHALYVEVSESRRFELVDEQ